MTNFIADNTSLPIDKTNLGALPPGANPRQWAAASEWITICQALLDVQAHCRAAVWSGFTLQAADPVPSGIANYLWVKADGTVWKTIGGVASTVGGGGVVFDDTVPADKVNIRSDRATNQSPIDNTLTQITNLGSQDLGTNAAAVGAIARGATIGGGIDNSARGNYSTVAGGAGNDAQNPYSAVVGGRNNTVTADNATVCGGYNNATDGNQSVIGGGHDNVITTGSNSVIAGGYSNNLGSASAAVIAGGYSNVMTGSLFQPVVSGGAQNSNTASWSSIPGGLGVKTTLQGQVAMGAGGFTDPLVAGEAQTSYMVMRGVTPGAATNEAVELLAGAGGTAGAPDKQLILEDGKAYAFKVTVVAGGTQAGPVRKSCTMTLEFNARRDAGTTVITASGAGAVYGDAATATWTTVATVGAGPDRLVLTFDTGAGAKALAHVVAKVEFTEVAY
jgi:hypothetical protein